MNKTVKEVQRECQINDPPVKVNQIWEVRTETGTLLRRLRILAPHPDPDPHNGGRRWIYYDLAGMMHSDRLGICPEFNLRFVFTLVSDYEIKYDSGEDRRQMDHL